MGIRFIWPVLMAVGIYFCPVSTLGVSAWKYRICTPYYRKVLWRAKTPSVVALELMEIQQKFGMENQNPSGKHHFWGLFTAPRMLYRILLGMGLNLFSNSLVQIFLLLRYNYLRSYGRYQQLCYSHDFRRREPRYDLLRPLYR